MLIAIGRSCVVHRYVSMVYSRIVAYVALARCVIEHDGLFQFYVSRAYLRAGMVGPRPANVRARWSLPHTTVFVLSSLSFCDCLTLAGDLRL